MSSEAHDYLSYSANIDKTPAIIINYLLNFYRVTGTLHLLLLILKKLYKDDSVIPILQIKKLRHKLFA